MVKGLALGSFPIITRKKECGLREDLGFVDYGSLPN